MHRISRVLLAKIHSLIEKYTMSTKVFRMNTAQYILFQVVTVVGEGGGGVDVATTMYPPLLHYYKFACKYNSDFADGHRAVPYFNHGAYNIPTQTQYVVVVYYCYYTGCRFGINAPSKINHDHIAAQSASFTINRYMLCSEVLARFGGRLLRPNRRCTGMSGIVKSSREISYLRIN